MVYWFTSSTRLRACKRCLSARLRWCQRERMGKRADTENHFCVRHASNQTASQLDLYSCIRKPIKRLWYLTSLATAGLHAACEPGCAHPQTNQPPSFAGQRAGRGEGVRSRSRSRRSVRGGTATPRGGMEYRDKLVLAPMVRVVTSSRPEPPPRLPRFRPLDLPSRLSSGGIRLRD